MKLLRYDSRQLSHFRSVCCDHRPTSMPTTILAILYECKNKTRSKKNIVYYLSSVCVCVWDGSRAVAFSLHTSACDNAGGVGRARAIRYQMHAFADRYVASFQVTHSIQDKIEFKYVVKCCNLRPIRVRQEFSLVPFFVCIFFSFSLSRNTNSLYIYIIRMDVQWCTVCGHRKCNKIHDGKTYDVSENTAGRTNKNHSDIVDNEFATKS